MSEPNKNAKMTDVGCEANDSGQVICSLNLHICIKIFLFQFADQEDEDGRQC